MFLIRQTNLFAVSLWPWGDCKFSEIISVSVLIDESMTTNDVNDGSCHIIFVTVIKLFKPKEDKQKKRVWITSVTLKYKINKILKPQNDATGASCENFWCICEHIWAPFYKTYQCHAKYKEQHIYNDQVFPFWRYTHIHSINFGVHMYPFTVIRYVIIYAYRERINPFSASIHFHSLVVQHSIFD